LTTWGVFGPILGVVLVDAAKSKLEWSHWEKDEGHGGELLGVFRFEVPRDRSQYEINYCCVAHQSATAVARLEPYRKIVGYHGTMTVDPASGTILRLVVEANLGPTDPVTKAGIVVDYGVVEIGGKEYTCPVRSLAMSVAQSVQVDPVYHYALANQIQPLKTAMNETTFTDYHVFRADARIITEEAAKSREANPQENSRQASSGTGTSAMRIEPSPQEAASRLAASSSGPAPESGSPAASGPALSASSVPDSSIPEVSVTGFAPLDASSPLVRPDTN
jgi:hypothetical protein